MPCGGDIATIPRCRVVHWTNENDPMKFSPRCACNFSSEEKTAFKRNNGLFDCFLSLHIRFAFFGASFQKTSLFILPCNLVQYTVIFPFKYIAPYVLWTLPLSLKHFFVSFLSIFKRRKVLDISKIC